MPSHGNISPTLEAESFTKRRADVLPVAQADIPREHVMLKFKGEDAEAVMAKALEGGSDSERRTTIPGANADSSPEKTLEKVKAFPSTSLPAGQPNPLTPILSSLRSPSAPSRPREAIDCLEEESSMKKRRPSNESSEKAKIDLVKVAGEDLYHVDDELSPVAEEVDEEDWEEEGNESEEAEVNGPECWRCDGEYEPEGDPEERIDRVADEVEENRLQKMQALEKPERSAEGIDQLPDNPQCI